MRAHLEAQGVSAASIDALIAKIDADKSGEITEDEFRAGFTEFITGQLTSVPGGSRQKATISTSGKGPQDVPTSVPSSERLGSTLCFF